MGRRPIMTDCTVKKSRYTESGSDAETDNTPVDLYQFLTADRGLQCQYLSIHHLFSGKSHYHDFGEARS